MSDNSTLLYVYGLADAPPQWASPQAECLPLAGMYALAARVPAQEFGQAALQTRTQDLDWLARQVSAHEAVLAEAMHTATVLPFKFPTVFQSEQSAVQAIGQQAPALQQRLAYLKGKQEWGVKLYLAQPDILAAQGPPSPELAALDAQMAELAQTAPGKAYLLRRRHESLRQQHLAHQASQAAAACFDALKAHGTDIKNTKLLSPKASGQPYDMVLNAACLVAREQEAPFMATCQQWSEQAAAQGLLLHLSGPWAAYHFV